MALTVLVDRVDPLLDCLEDIESCMNRQDAVAAIDCEGVDLDRHGKLCTVQIRCRGASTTYVVDVVELKEEAFTTTTETGFSLKYLIERKDKVKLFFDPRYDSDALWHQFGVYPGGVFCLQMADVALRRQMGHRVNFVLGLSKVIKKYVQLTKRDELYMERVKEEGKQLFLSEMGGSFDVWLDRPLHESLVEYAACDVKYMIDAYITLRTRLSQLNFNKVLSISAARVGNCKGHSATGGFKPTSAPLF